MKFQYGNKRRQAGAVAIMVALMICVLIGLLGMVIDIAHLSIRKTELQNAADAAALAGVRQFNGKDSGIDAASLAARSMAAANASDFGRTPVVIGDQAIAFATTPDGPWLDASAAKSIASGIGFIKVDTQGIAQGTRATWFVPLLALFNPASAAALASTTATGVAVAGATLCEGVPLFICPPPGGFLPGHAYFFADKPGSPVGPGNIGYFDPVMPGSQALINGVDDMRDIICSGKTYCLGPGSYSSLTQSAFGSMARAFNSRFDDYGSLPSKLTPAICRPDINIKEYPFNQITWMTTAPVQQSESNGVPGVRWSALSPSAADVAQINANYPVSGTPYGQRAQASFYLPPASQRAVYAQTNRRILTMAIGAASACNGSINGSGQPVQVTGFGRFFMTVKAVGTGGSKGIYVEYIETVERQIPSAPDIKLYR